MKDNTHQAQIRGVGSFESLKEILSRYNPLENIIDIHQKESLNAEEAKNE